MIEGHHDGARFTDEFTDPDLKRELKSMQRLTTPTTLREDVNPLAFFEAIDEEIKARLLEASTSNDGYAFTRAVNHPLDATTEEVDVISGDPPHISILSRAEVRDE